MIKSIKETLCLGFLIFFAHQAHGWVNPINGSFSEVIPFRIKGNPDFQLEIIYNSQNQGSQLLGAGWCTNLDHRLDLSGAKPQFVYCGSGEKVPVEVSSGPSKSGTAPVLVKEENRSVVTFSNGQKMYFNLEGQMVGLWDSLGQHVISRGKGRIAIISDGVEIARLETTAEGKLKTLQMQGQVAQVTWEKENLKRIQSGVQKWSFEYDSKNRLRTWESPKSKLAIQYNQADLVQSVNHRGCLETLKYQSPKSGEVEVQVSSSCAKDLTQAQRKFTLSKQSGVLQVTETNEKTNEVTVMNQNEADGSTSSIVRNDGTQMLFDSKGRVFQVTKGSRNEVWKYLENGQVQIDVMQENHVERILLQLNASGQVDSIAINQHKFKTVFASGIVQELRGEKIRAIKAQNQWQIKGSSEGMGLRSAGEKLSMNTAVETLTRFNSVKDM